MADGVTLPWLTLDDLPGLFTSYAQSFEDVILARVLAGDSGFYIDAGANDPEFHSVTKHFHEKGWSGVNIEPHRSFHRRLCEARPRDVNLNVGLSDREAIATFHEEAGGTGISSLTDVFDSWNVGLTVEDRPIEVTTLARVCERYAAGRTIDFLKVDVEGVERLACEGGDWSRYRPRVVLIEAPWPEFFEDWDAWFRARDYLFACFDGLNRFYARAEDRDLIPALAVPYSSLDRAIPHQQVRLIRQQAASIRQLQAELDDMRRRESRRVVRRVKSLARRLPRAATAVRRIVGRALAS